MDLPIRCTWKHGFDPCVAYLPRFSMERLIYTVSPRFYGLIQTGACPESEKIRTLKIDYNTVLYCTVNSLYCLAHMLIGYNMVQYTYIVYMRVKYGYTCNRVQYNINPKTAVYIHIHIHTVSPRFYGLIQIGPCPESEKVQTLKIEYNTVLYCTVNSLYCLIHILIGYNMVQYAYTVYMRVKQ